MEIKRLLYSKHSSTFISIILGIGLASLFRKVCKERNCVVFRAPVLDDIQKKIFQHGQTCYEYLPVSEKCSNSKKQIGFFSHGA